ncbi:LytR/AlgR family response regulator transcription factor [Sporohalobacter salinus]|uniref:LytR/AlgR family response regulator transcription factor n=1 Tax=Sporohalobacter salinus TaxID=1494606 RepID=UPI001960ADFE|nr:LytTR family DNA-binding domain-containing protein [Sporohalobacter salinus]MBM7623839.1 two-component system LytT family response regulator/two-component system response regulator LytT [Sporohalobacter salinus]
MKLETVIVDDELPARDELKFLLSDLDELEVIAEASTGQQALEIITKQKPDVAFLDIQMPGKSGMEIAEEILTWEKKPLIVFITAYDRYAIKAFELNAQDYLLKPFTEERFAKTIERILDKYQMETKTVNDQQLEKLIASMNPRSNSLIKIPVNSKQGRIKLLDEEEVIFAYTKNGDVYIKICDNEYKSDFTLSELEDKLPNPNFFRVHRSYIANLEKIKEVIPWFKGKYRLVMGDQLESEIPVSRNKIKKLKEIINL